jgi:hypothetical protein
LYMRAAVFCLRLAHWHPTAVARRQSMSIDSKETETRTATFSIVVDRLV